MQAIVVIGDIIGSSRIKGRRAFQENFSREIELLNRGRQFASPYTVTLGDEFQAVYRDATTLFNDLFTLIAGLLPQRIRLSIGVGHLTTKFNRHQAIGMDGPAFHVAREGIDLLRERSDPICIRAAKGDVTLEDQAARSALQVVAADHACV